MNKLTQEHRDLEADILTFVRNDVATATYEVAHAFKLDTKQANKILSKMEKAGYIRRLPWKRDNNILWSANLNTNKTNQLGQSTSGDE